MQGSTLIAGALLLFAVTSQIQASVINPVVEYTSATNTPGAPSPYTIGYEFTTSTTFTLNALGYFDDGLGNNHQVGIWDSVGNLLVSTTVLGTDALVGHFRYDAINYVLGPGTYVIGGEYLGNNDLVPINATGVTSLPGYTWVDDRQIPLPGLNFPTIGTGGAYGDNGILTVDFSVATTVPEIDPSTGGRAIALLLVALFALFGRQKKDRSRVGA